MAPAIAADLNHKTGCTLALASLTPQRCGVAKSEEPSNFSAFVALTHANSDSIGGFYHATHVQMWDGICCAYEARARVLSTCSPTTGQRTQT
jgi:hypothetical protein